MQQFNGRNLTLTNSKMANLTLAIKPGEKDAKTTFYFHKDGETEKILNVYQSLN